MAIFRLEKWEVRVIFPYNHKYSLLHYALGLIQPLQFDRFNIESPFVLLQMSKYVTDGTTKLATVSPIFAMHPSNMITNIWEMCHDW